MSDKLIRFKSIKTKKAQTEEMDEKWNWVKELVTSG